MFSNATDKLMHAVFIAVSSPLPSIICLDVVIEMIDVVTNSAQTVSYTHTCCQYLDQVARMAPLNFSTIDSTRNQNPRIARENLGDHLCHLTRHIYPMCMCKG